MWKNIGSAAGGAWNWFMGSPIAQMVGAGLAFLLAWEATKMKLKADGAAEQKRLHKAADDRERAEMAIAEKEVADEVHARVEGAERAVERFPHLSDPGQLRRDYPELAAIVLRQDQGVER